jgi:hypothetical protein
MMKVVLFAAVLALSGCVSKEILPEHSPRLTTAQNSDGLVSMSWKSEVGYKYWIYVMDPADHVWSPLKGVDAFRGTGEIITFRDKRNPRLPLPWYSLRSEKL